GFFLSILGNFSNLAAIHPRYRCLRPFRLFGFESGERVGRKCSGRPDFKADCCLTESLLTGQMRAEGRDAPQPVFDFIQSDHSAGLLAFALDTNAFSFYSDLVAVMLGN